ncbi:MAG: ABC transporter substrate-binding protein [Gemmatimonadetes bacterium]|nr:ABC transporter substrate-binding protein [Gemmatimonadota bacterium]
MRMEAGQDMAGMEMTGGGDSLRVEERGVALVAHFTRYSGWPELKEAFIAGNVGAAYLLAPLAMDLADRGVPVRIVALGHRSGAVIMVRKDSPARNLGDLRGKRVAIPSRFAVDHLFVRRLMRQHGLLDGEVQLVELAPPDMPAALYADAVDAYATGEPFGAQAQREGYARVLHWTRDEWPDYVCCVLAVRTDLIRDVRPLVQRLVDNVLSAGVWLEGDSTNRLRAADLAARPEYFNQDPALLRFVLTNPRNRVTYGDLRLIRPQLEELMNLALEARVIDHPIPYETYADESFLRAYRPREIRIEQR